MTQQRLLSVEVVAREYATASAASSRKPGGGTIASYVGAANTTVTGNSTIIFSAFGKKKRICSFSSWTSPL